MDRAVPLVFVLLLAPLLAGCTVPGGPPPPPPPATGACARLVCDQVYVSSAAAVRVDSPYGWAHIDGPALVLPARVNGTEAAAVLLGSSFSWRADEVFQLTGRDNIPSNVFVQPPLGSWEALKQAWSLKPASAADLLAQGFNGTQAAIDRANLTLPSNDTAPVAGRWVLNGSFVVKVDPGSLTFATEVGPFVFNRNATNLIVIEHNTIVSWSPLNHTLDVENDGIARMELLSDEVAQRLTASWNATTFESVLHAPAPFRQGDVQFTDQAGKIAQATIKDVGSVTFIKYTPPAVVQDNLVEIKNRNVTFRILGP